MARHEKPGSTLTGKDWAVARTPPRVLMILPLNSNTVTSGTLATLNALSCPSQRSASVDLISFAVSRFTCSRFGMTSLVPRIPTRSWSCHTLKAYLGPDSSTENLEIQSGIQPWGPVNRTPCSLPGSSTLRPPCIWSALRFLLKNCNATQKPSDGHN